MAQTFPGAAVPALEIPGLFDGQEAVTHPSSGGSVPADVGKSLLVVPVWCTEGHFLYSLVNNHTLTDLIYDS